MAGAMYSVTYRIVVDEGVVCAAAIGERDNDAAPGTACRVDLDFSFVQTPEVHMIRVETPNGTPGDDVIEEQRRRIASLMPIPDVVRAATSNSGPLGGFTSDLPEPTDVLAKLMERREGNSMVYLGVMLGTADTKAGGTYHNHRVAAWYTVGADGEDATGNARNVGVP